MLPLAALAKTGTTTLIAHHLVDTLGDLGPTGMLAVVFLVDTLMQLFISRNSAAAVLIAPAMPSKRPRHCTSRRRGSR